MSDVGGATPHMPVSSIAIGTGLNPALPADTLRAWWMDTASGDYDLIGPRVQDYASYDLDVLGRVTLEMVGLPSEDSGLRVEVACLWFAQAKIARALSAYREGRRPTDDTLADLTAYTMMARRARHSGGWPGIEDDIDRERGQL